VGWADRLFKIERGAPIGWAQGFGILFDDFVAAGCTLAVIALWRVLMG
jgi:phosphatidylglycerophosphatase A